MGSLVSVEWLHEHLDQVVILDATMPTVASKEEERNQNKVIPNARFFDLKKIFNATDAPFPNTVPSAEAFEKGASALGLNANTRIVIYDRKGVHTSPRAWYLFKIMGHKNVAVLSGGLPAWEAAGHSTNESYATDIEKTEYHAKKDEDLIRSFEFVNQHLDNPHYKVLDARSSGRFTGTSPEPRPNLHSGCIPNSVNVPYTEVLHDGYMKSKEELEKVFGEEVIVSDKLIASCGSGLTACILLLALDQIGKKNTSLFDGSWTEWATRKGLFVK